MKIKVFFVLSFLLLSLTVYGFNQLYAEEMPTNKQNLQEPQIVILEPPITVTNRMTLDDFKPEDRLPFVELELAYDKCETWDEVLELHTAESVKLIELMEMKEGFKEGKEAIKTEEFGFTYISYLTAELNGEQIMIAQFIPFQLKDKDYSDYDFYFPEACRKVGGEWKYDNTLTTSELGFIMTNYPPSCLKEEVRKWYLEKVEKIWRAEPGEDIELNPDTFPREQDAEESEELTKSQ